ncbi:hypothetical protein pipiens_013874 [Culex pipiens pipiens]|uniref:Uncharacterized protein n=1 Tax=Culex pipiens pipiens TaxID=38569 RepID=A0ABD1CZ84_CULPP
MQARIEQDYQNDCKKLQMDWEMRLASLRLRDKVATGNSIKAGEEQEEESKKVELRDQVRRYEVGSTMAKQAETTNVDLENLGVATFGSGASVDSTAGKSGADRTLESFSSDSATVELSFEVRVVETTVQTRSVSNLCLATPANAQTPEIQNLPNNISVTSFANDEVCLDMPLQNHGLVPARSYARMDRQKEDVDVAWSSRSEGQQIWELRDHVVQKQSDQQLQRSTQEQQAGDHDEPRPPRPPYQPFHSDGLTETREEPLLDHSRTSEEGSWKHVNGKVMPSELFKIFGQPQLVSTFIDTSPRCRDSGAERWVVRLNPEEEKLFTKSGVRRRRSLLRMEPWCMMRGASCQFDQPDTLVIHGVAMQDLYYCLGSRSPEASRSDRRKARSYGVETINQICVSIWWGRTLPRSTGEAEVASFCRAHSTEMALKTLDQDAVSRTHKAYPVQCRKLKVDEHVRAQPEPEWTATGYSSVASYAIVGNRLLQMMEKENYPTERSDKDRGMQLSGIEKHDLNELRFVMVDGAPSEASMAERGGRWLSGQRPLEIVRSSGADGASNVKHRRIVGGCESDLERKEF